jgi:hypothetical protein
MVGNAIKKELETWADVEAALADYRAHEIASRKIRAQLDQAVMASTQRFSDPLGVELEAMDALSERLRAFVWAHRREFKSTAEGSEGRTRVLHDVEIGLRTGKPYVDVPKNKAEAALAWLAEFGGDTYVHPKPQLAKATLKADLVRAQDLAATGDAPSREFIQKLAEHYITLKQDEEFVLEVSNG